MYKLSFDYIFRDKLEDFIVQNEFNISMRNNKTSYSGNISSHTEDSVMPLKLTNFAFFRQFSNIYKDNQTEKVIDRSFNHTVSAPMNAIRQIDKTFISHLLNGGMIRFLIFEILLPLKIYLCGLI